MAEEGKGRQSKRFSVMGALQGNRGDQETQGIEFQILKNCYVDERIGAVVKRGGSTTETIASGLGLPIAVGEHLTAAPGSAIPLSRATLVNFSGTFYQWKSNTWSSVSKTANTSFAASQQGQMNLLGTKLYLSCGRPAVWGGPGTSVERMGIPRPTTAPITATGAAGTITVTETVQYMVTYYNPTTGLESDWSPLSAALGPFTAKQVTVTLPVDSTLTNATHKRIYRTNDGGSAPYLVDTVTMATTSYTDDKTDAQLTTRAALVGRKGLPPSVSYINHVYASRVWMVDAENPYLLRFSLPYTGNDSDCELFPTDFFVVANQPITGLLAIPGRMLVFHPRSISYISGTSEDDFSFQPWKTGIGTLFANSIATDGAAVICLGEEGWIDITKTPRHHISREIDHDLQPLMAGSYNSAMYAGACYNHSLRQFVCFVTAETRASWPWEDSSDAGIEEWEDSATLVTETWEDPTASSPSATVRVKIWGYSAELSDDASHRWMEYEFPTITDSNGSGAYPTLLHHPSPSSDLTDPQQDKTLLCFWSGTEGKVRTAFRRDKGVDDSATAITSTLVTGRIQPGEPDGKYRRFVGISFASSYVDPTADSSGTLKYLLDFEDPHLRSYNSSLKLFSQVTTDIKRLTEGLGRHMRLELVDTSTSTSKVLLSEFHLHYRPRFRRDNR